ncbi:MAG TPA: flagellar biosynthesis anti-sigma factor FlgM [Burkholderiaceae bacterium]|nr:flagellar biosynthesis anti-sigma factor FlgM [Burkholderiaceae bacterium]
MRISGAGRPDTPEQVTAVAPAAESTSTAAAAPVSPLQAETLQPAMQALQQMPEIDQGRVDALRDKLARGEVPFDAKRLAALIQRFHGGRV